jgi:hypothetical protein
LKTVGDICGDSSFLGDISIERKMFYKSWIVKEQEQLFVDMYMWAGEYHKQLILIY